jgi:hypothetical protein
LRRTQDDKKAAELAAIEAKRQEEIAKIRAAAEAAAPDKRVQDSMNWQEEMELNKKKKAEAAAKKKIDDEIAAKKAAEAAAASTKVSLLFCVLRFAF